MAANVHTPDELLELLVVIITGAAGGTPARWRRAVGKVQKLPIANNVRSNWQIVPKATGAELAVISQAVTIVRAEHPYVAG